MSKEKLSYEQNIALKDLNLQEKLNLLHQWKKSKEITQAAFEHFSNLWIKKESKKVILDKNPLRRFPEETKRLSSSRSVVEGEIMEFNQFLRSRINLHIANRNVDVTLTDQEFGKFQRYIKDYPYYHALINRMVILGLRFPDQRLNDFCYDFAKENRKDNASFWLLLWEDVDFVALDAVRLMLIKKEDEHIINEKSFSRGLVKELIPLIEGQREKEVERLSWAQMLEGQERERQMARKSHRLNAFNLLLEAAKKYCE